MDLHVYTDKDNLSLSSMICMKIYGKRLSINSINKILHFLSGIEPVSYEQKFKDSYIYQELKKARNIRPSFNTSAGLWGGLLYTGLMWWPTQGREPWTFKHHKGGRYDVYFQCPCAGVVTLKDSCI